MAYPSQTIKLMVPNPAGGLPDTVARIVGHRLQERLEQSVVVENRPGANGRVAVAALLNAEPRRLHPPGDRRCDHFD